jgi:hypothetical protein
LYSARQLVALACQIAKVNNGMATQVGQFLNMILADYAQVMDIDTVRKTTTFAVTSQNTGVGITKSGYLLPVDYLREVQVFYNIDGTIFDLDQISLEKYYTLFQGTGVADYPESYATDISDQAVAEYGAPILYFWPPPAIALEVNLLYRPQTSDITNPETSSVVPWFPNQRILLKDLVSETMMLGDDSRKESVDKEIERRMRKFLIMKDDSTGFAVNVKLDRQLFRPKNNLPPTKQTSIF